MPKDAVRRKRNTKYNVQVGKARVNIFKSTCVFLRRVIDSLSCQIGRCLLIEYTKDAAGFRKLLEARVAVAIAVVANRMNRGCCC
jgi:hypothetical protein